ncbi:MAG: hypothetical protein JSV88_16560 [Candidatus Aminicenantes bacterium]|nr:MAG: hypothetical protein JSV88_16560 [Candidatus Aminicenantes bacterium]
MKKTGRVLKYILTVVIMILIFAPPGSAAKEKAKEKKARKHINILGALGLATSSFDDPLIDIGVELQLVQQFYFRFIINTHLDTGGGYYYDPYHYSAYYWPYQDYGRNGNILHGLNAFGVYKISLSKKARLFAQAGLNYIYYWRYENISDYMYWKRGRVKGFGAGLGTGVELNLGKKLGIIGGGTYERLFADEPPENPDDPSPGKPSWVKIYVGLYYRVK